MLPPQGGVAISAPTTRKASAATRAENAGGVSLLAGLRALCGESSSLSKGLGLAEQGWSLVCGNSLVESTGQRGRGCRGCSTGETGGQAGGRGCPVPPPGCPGTSQPPAPSTAAMEKKCRAGPGRPAVCTGLTSPSPDLPLSGQVNNATARVMTNKKTANPYTNGKGLGTPGRPRGQRPWRGPGCWRLPPWMHSAPLCPSPKGPSPGRGKRGPGTGPPWTQLAFPSVHGTLRPCGQASGTVRWWPLPG